MRNELCIIFFGHYSIVYFNRVDNRYLLFSRNKAKILDPNIFDILWKTINTITKRNICSALTLHARFRVSWSTFFSLRFDGLIAFFSGNRQEKIACEVWGVKRQVLLQNESNFFLSYKARLARNERTIFVEWTTTKHDLYHLSSCLKLVFARCTCFWGCSNIPRIKLPDDSKRK